MGNINGPIPQEWAGYVTQTNVGLEVLPATLYDTQLYTSATTTILTFFTSVPANESISNVNPPSVLANPNSFLLKTIGLYVPNTLETVLQGGAAPSLASQINDIIVLVNTGICKLTIGSKPYGPWPMYRLPIATYVRATATAAGAAAANVLSAYGQLDGPMYPILPPLVIAPMQQFKLTLEWPAGAVTLSGNRNIKVVLDGQLSRAIQ